MWVNKQVFATLTEQVLYERTGASRLSASTNELRVQKAKDDLSIDWLRHRVNALEKLNAVLLNKVAGIHVPVPELVPTRPGTVTQMPSFDHLPSFEDSGDEEAQRLGIMHADDGSLVYK